MLRTLFFIETEQTEIKTGKEARVRRIRAVL